MLSSRGGAIPLRSALGPLAVWCRSRQLRISCKTVQPGVVHTQAMLERSDLSFDFGLLDRHIIANSQPRGTLYLETTRELVAVELLWGFCLFIGFPNESNICISRRFWLWLRDGPPILLFTLDICGEFQTCWAKLIQVLIRYLEHHRRGNMSGSF